MHGNLFKLKNLAPLFNIHMKKLLALLFITASFLSCKQEKKIEDKSFPLEVACYGYNANGTSISFRITRVDPVVQGTLIYNWAEKDRNSGSFKGTLEGNTILGSYTFLAEGKQSIREVAFKIEKGKLIEGFGAIKNVGGVATFENTTTLTYDGSIVLEKDACLN